MLKKNLKMCAALFSVQSLFILYVLSRYRPNRHAEMIAEQDFMSEVVIAPAREMLDIFSESIGSILFLCLIFSFAAAVIFRTESYGGKNGLFIGSLAIKGKKLWLTNAVSVMLLYCVPYILYGGIDLAFCYQAVDFADCVTAFALYFLIGLFAASLFLLTQSLVPRASAALGIFIAAIFAPRALLYGYTVFFGEVTGYARLYLLGGAGPFGSFNFLASLAFPRPTIGAVLIFAAAVFAFWLAYRAAAKFNTLVGASDYGRVFAHRYVYYAARYACAVCFGSYFCHYGDGKAMALLIFIGGGALGAYIFSKVTAVVSGSREIPREASRRKNEKMELTAQPKYAVFKQEIVAHRFFREQQSPIKQEIVAHRFFREQQSPIKQEIVAHHFFRQQQSPIQTAFIHELKELKWPVLVMLCIALYLLNLTGNNYDQLYANYIVDIEHGLTTYFVRALPTGMVALMMPLTFFVIKQLGAADWEFLFSMPLKKKELLGIKLAAGVTGMSAVVLFLGAGLMYLYAANRPWIELNYLELGADLDGYGTILLYLFFLWCFGLFFYLFSFFIGLLVRNKAAAAVLSCVLVYYPFLTFALIISSISDLLEPLLMPFNDWLLYFTPITACNPFDDLNELSVNGAQVMGFIYDWKAVAIYLLLFVLLGYGCLRLLQSPRLVDSQDFVLIPLWEKIFAVLFAIAVGAVLMNIFYMMGFGILFTAAALAVGFCVGIFGASKFFSFTRGRKA